MVSSLLAILLTINPPLPGPETRRVERPPQVQTAVRTVQGSCLMMGEEKLPTRKRHSGHPTRRATAIHAVSVRRPVLTHRESRIAYSDCRMHHRTIVQIVKRRRQSDQRRAMRLSVPGAELDCHSRLARDKPFGLTQRRESPAPVCRVPSPVGAGAAVNIVVSDCRRGDCPSRQPPWPPDAQTRITPALWSSSLQ